MGDWGLGILQRHSKSSLSSNLQKQIKLDYMKYQNENEEIYINPLKSRYYIKKASFLSFDNNLLCLILTLKKNIQL
jgi:hypothetical protein